MANLDSILKSREITLPTNIRLVKAMVSALVMHGCWELDSKESWAPKSWCFWSVVLEKTLESPLDCKEIKLVHPEGDQSWIFIGRTDAEVETPILWPSDLKNWVIGKYPDAGKDWSREEKGMTEGEMVGRHRWLYWHEFERASGVGDGQGILACCCSCSCKESDTTERLSWTQLMLDSYDMSPLPPLCGWLHSERLLWGSGHLERLGVSILALLLASPLSWGKFPTFLCSISSPAHRRGDNSSTYLKRLFWGLSRSTYNISEQSKFSISTCFTRDFLRGPVVKTLLLHCSGHLFDLWLGN